MILTTRYRITRRIEASEESGRRFENVHECEELVGTENGPSVSVNLQRRIQRHRNPSRVDLGTEIGSNTRMLRLPDARHSQVTVRFLTAFMVEPLSQERHIDLL